MSSTPPVLDVDLTEHALYRDGFPYERFAELRREHAVWRHPTADLSRSPDGIEFWAVLGHPSCSRSAATGGRSAPSTARASRRPETPSGATPSSSSDPPGAHAGCAS